MGISPPGSKALLVRVIGGSGVGVAGMGVSVGIGGVGVGGTDVGVDGMGVAAGGGLGPQPLIAKATKVTKRKSERSFLIFTSWLWLVAHCYSQHRAHVG